MFDPYLSLELDGIEPTGVKKKGTSELDDQMIEGKFVKKKGHTWLNVSMFDSRTVFDGTAAAVWWVTMGDLNFLLCFSLLHKSLQVKRWNQAVLVSLLTCSVDIEENTVMNLWDSVSAYKWYLFGKHTQTPETQMCRFPTINYQPSHFRCHKQIQ